jgi:hypothetical protein
MQNSRVEFCPGISIPWNNTVYLEKMDSENHVKLIYEFCGEIFVLNKIKI